MQRVSSIRQILQQQQNKGGSRKITLADLFSGEKLVNNFQSYEKQKTKLRPQTMQVHRARNPMLRSTSNIGLKTQERIRRTTSHMNGFASNDYKQVKQEQKLKIRKIYGRINLLVDGVEMDEQKQLLSIFDFIKALASTHNHHQKGFNYIAHKLEETVYVNSDLKLLKLIAEKTKNPLAIRIVMKKINAVTYKELCSELLSEMKKQIENKDIAEDQMNQLIQQLRLKVDQKNEAIERLKRQLQYYTKHPSQDLYPYIKILEETIKQNKIIISNLNEQNREHQNNVEMFKQTNMALTDKITEYKNKIYQHQLQKLSGMKNVQKNSQLKDFEQNVDTLKQMLHKSTIRIEGVRQQYDKLKQYNNELINERSKLAKRAAVGFQQLTPRPNFKKIFEENEMNYEKILNTQASTDDIVSLLVKTCKSLYDEKGWQFAIKRDDVSEDKQQDLKKKTKRKESKKSVAQLAFNQMKSASQQINKTISAASEVKKAYNKQKNQRESLQTHRKNM